MSTRAEKFKSDQQRVSSEHKRRSAQTMAGTPAAKAVQHEIEKLSTTSQNLSDSAARKAAFALEDSDAARPSRKSTRKNSNQQKPDSQLQRRETRRTHSPQTRSVSAK